MVAANYSTVRNNLKEYCDKATDNNEIIIVTRKNEKNIVIMSLDRLNALEKELQNAQYIAKLEKGFAQIEEGKGIVRDIIEVDC